MGLSYHFTLTAPLTASAAELLKFLKSVEADAQSMGFHPTMVLDAAFDTPERRAVSQSGESVLSFTHWGTLRCLRSEISICRDQTEAASFKPMRIVLPYGKWTCADGTEVLFNRDYRPIWKKHPNGVVVAADPNEWVNHSKQEFFFGDHNTPDEDLDSYRVCMNRLRDWRVQHEVPVMFNLFRQAVAAGDLEQLERLEQSIHDN